MRFSRKALAGRVIALLQKKLFDIGGLMGAMPPPLPQDLPDSMAHNVWDDFTKAIMDEVRRSPASFLREPMISRTVHPNQQTLAEAYLSVMESDAFCREFILTRMADVPFGNPYQCRSFPLASPLTVQHAFYCSLMKKHLNVFLPENDIQHFVEFGGGYGNFCRLMRGWGYAGRYVIIDLSAMHVLQRHYLSGACGPWLTKGIDFARLDDEGAWACQGASCFMATFSMNETSLETRRQIEKHIDKFSHFFIAYNSSFEGVDNVVYFSKLTERLACKFNTVLLKDKYRRAWFLLGSINNCCQLGVSEGANK